MNFMSEKLLIKILAKHSVQTEGAVVKTDSWSYCYKMCHSLMPIIVCFIEEQSFLTAKIKTEFFIHWMSGVFWINIIKFTVGI